MLKTPEQIGLVISSLRQGVVTLIKDLNGNHVVQRCLQRLSTEDSQVQTFLILHFFLLCYVYLTYILLLLVHIWCSCISLCWNCHTSAWMLCSSTLCGLFNGATTRTLSCRNCSQCIGLITGCFWVIYLHLNIPKRDSSSLFISCRNISYCLDYMF